MESLYIDYDKINMILTIKCFEEDILKCKKKLELSEDFIVSLTYSENNELFEQDVYGFVIAESNSLESGMSTIHDINDYDLKSISKNI